jgi:hypothetical protein
MKTLGDRRAEVRLEVLGSLYGTLDLDEQTKVVNISGGGALVTATQPVTVDSTQVVRLTLDGQQLSLEARVRHATRVEGRGEEPQYQIGLEFLKPPAALALALE